MLERLAFVVWLAVTSFSIGVVGVSPWFTWPQPGLAVFLAGSGGCILAWLLGRFGREKLHFAECEDSLQFRDPSADGDRADHLRRVFDTWEELDAQRESGSVDVWRVQELRREAASLLQRDPRLRAEFEHELSRHPELGDR